MADVMLNKLSVILTGITELDNITRGFYPSELILIGARPGGSYFNGTINGFQIYNRALSEEEVKTLYENEK